MSEKEALLPARRIFCNQYSKVRNCAVKSHLAHMRHSKTKKKHENKKLFELNVHFVRILIGFIYLFRFF